MAANKSVIVLMPNGRREDIKVTPNTTILQILENACQKHGLDADQYDIMHFKKTLDTSAIFRFSGLPNNAQLRLVPCTKSRIVSNVTIGIQLEDGSRLIGEFSPNTALTQILNELYPDHDLSTTVLIYMQCEVFGKERLEKTTLKTLGLNSGKAILRLINRDPEQEKYQAHVHVPLLRPNKDSSSKSENKQADHTNSSNTGKENTNALKHSELPTSTNREQCETENEQHQDLLLENTDQLSKKDETNSQLQATDLANSAQSEDKDITNVSCREENLKIEFLGPRNALIFNQAGAQAFPRDELPDNFYDLTDNDVKLLSHDLTRKRKQLEDAPLLTEAQRKLDRNKKLLEQLYKYKRTVIRVQFPDQFVLQGLFEPLETVQAVKDFIKTYLEDQESDFSVFTAPPKHILDPATRLIDENLVPSAIIYYSGTSTISSPVKEKLTDPRAAGIQAIKSRMELIRQEDDANKNVTPKWFKMAK